MSSVFAVSSSTFMHRDVCTVKLELSLVVYLLSCDKCGASVVIM